MKNGIIVILTIFILTSGIANGQLTIKDQEATPNILLQVNDEGTSGSITLPPLSSITTFANKLYNIGNILFWDGVALGTYGSAAGWTDLGSNVILSSPTDKVGIGTASPSAALHVNGNDGILFEGTLGSGTIPKQGAGTRMMWYPQKSAFRAGHIDGSEWDVANIGNNSTAMGYGTIASGLGSTAMGTGSTASGDWSTAMGTGSIASGGSSTAMGNNTTASGAASTATGDNTKAESILSTVIGSKNIGGGSADTWIDTDPLFEIGNGVLTPSNAMTVLKNGKVGIGPASPTATLHVTGNDGVLFTGNYGSGIIPAEGVGTRMMWYPKKAAFRAGLIALYPPNTTAPHWDDANIGTSSVAFGTNTTASGDNSTAMGSFSTASNSNSTAMGLYSIASGRSSTAMGSYTIAESNSSTAIGFNNIGSGSPDNWIGTDPLFEIGNGYAGPPSNALTVLKNGNVGIGMNNPSFKLDITGGNFLVRGDHGYTASGHQGIVFLGSVHSYIKAEYGYGVKIGAYAAPDAISIKESSGDVGIGTTNPKGKLDVNGAIYQRGSTLHADYVFEDDYELESIEEHSEFMWENKHLKAIPKATVDENGIEYVEVGSHRKGIVEELEKAHIYISQLEESIKLLTKRIEKLESKN